VCTKTLTFEYGGWCDLRVLIMNPHGLTWSVDPTAFAERAVVDGFVNTR
jgi:hypothetical protein